MERPLFLGREESVSVLVIFENLDHDGRKLQGNPLFRGLIALPEIRNGCGEGKNKR